jgi:signal transduction histidine kinase
MTSPLANEVSDPLLRGQIDRFLDDSPPQAGLAALLGAVDAVYRRFVAEREAVERTLVEASAELTLRNDQLRRQLAERMQAERELQREHQEQQALIRRLEEAHHQLLQSEKLASIGQLAAGVAHEINNPVGFVHANLGTLRGYAEDLLRLVDCAAAAVAPTQAPQVAALRAEIDFDFLREDLRAVLDETEDGVRRVRRIVQDLKDFSHVDQGALVWADLHQGLDSTLNIVNNEIKYKAVVERRYGDLPEVQCYASQLNQVFLNLLVNAAHAIPEQGRITVTTGREDDAHVFVEIADDGCGIAPENLRRIFDPFFTTKPVGQGTGLGLSLSYGIVQRHHGRIDVASEPGRGTAFRVVVPVRQPGEAAHA